MRVDYRVAFWGLLHASSHEQGLIETVNRGRDTDRNGAVTGALLGALLGSEGFAGEWLDCAPRGPWDGVYHSKMLVRR